MLLEQSHIQHILACYIHTTDSLSQSHIQHISIPHSAHYSHFYLLIYPSVYFEILLEQSHIRHTFTCCIRTFSPTFAFSVAHSAHHSHFHLLIYPIFRNFIRTVPHSAHHHLLHSHSQSHIQHSQSHIQHIICTFISLFILCIFRNFIRTVPHSAHPHLLHSHSIPSIPSSSGSVSSNEKTYLSCCYDNYVDGVEFGMFCQSIYL
jgi:hypothetical protein